MRPLKKFHDPLLLMQLFLLLILCSSFLPWLLPFRIRDLFLEAWPFGTSALAETAFASASFAFAACRFRRSLPAWLVLACLMAAQAFASLFLANLCILPEAVLPEICALLLAVVFHLSGRDFDMRNVGWLFLVFFFLYAGFVISETNVAWAFAAGCFLAWVCYMFFVYCKCCFLVIDPKAASIRGGSLFSRTVVAMVELSLIFAKAQARRAGRKLCRPLPGNG